MNSSLLTKSINEDSYEDYIEQVMNIYRLSSKDKSIIGNIKITGKKIIASLSILNSVNGYLNKFTDIVFNHSESFYDRFIKELVRRMNNECNVSFNDLVTEENIDEVTYRMVTENNDMFTIEGLDRVKADNIISDYNGEKNCEPKELINSSSLGEGNYLIFITMIVIIILTLILVYIMMK